MSVMRTEAEGLRERETLEADDLPDGRSGADWERCGTGAALSASGAFASAIAGGLVEEGSITPL